MSAPPGPTAHAPVDGPPTAEDRAPTWFLDADHPDVVAHAAAVTAGAGDPAEAARRLFADVRDRLRYDPYRIATEPEAYRASTVLAAERAWCVPKALLLTTLARAAGIPARLGFADVRNHLSSPKLSERMGTDLFVYHGYSLLHVHGAWRKASPAFNAELCARFGTEPLDFDGRADALLHAATGDGTRHMEYVADRGAHRDLPLQRMLTTFVEVYGRADATGDDHDAAFHG